MTTNGEAKLFSLNNAQQMADWVDALQNFNVYKRRDDADAEFANEQRRMQIALRAMYQPPVFDIESPYFTEVLSVSFVFCYFFKYFLFIVFQISTAKLTLCGAVMSEILASMHAMRLSTRVPAARPNLNAYGFKYARVLPLATLMMGWQMPHGTLNDTSSIARLAVRAHSCQVAHVLGFAADGVRGQDGLRGRDGASGSHGMGYGGDGYPGGHGSIGTPGTFGTPGFAGASANLMLLNVDPSQSAVTITGSYSGELKLGERGVLLVNAKGGNGGGCCRLFEIVRNPSNPSFVIVCLLIYRWWSWR